jgi:xylulokinase
MGCFLGLDSSTQSLSAMVVDTDEKRIVLDESVNFGAELPAYASPHGVLPNADPAIRHSDPLMWVEALELLLARVKSRGFDWSRVDGISGAGQQHGSIYFQRPLREVGGWKSEQSLVDQVRPLLSRSSAPMWMDSSTGKAVSEIAQAAGGADVVRKISGSIPIERFTGPQIRKFYQEEPARYESTAEIQLVSSFMASLLIGGSAPIDRGDAAGMNLFDLERDDWSPLLLDATAPGLAARLGKAVASNTVVGTLSEYFARRYGFRSGIPVVAFSGDNPSSLVGMGACEPGRRVISLGTSDTMFAAMPQPTTDPNGYGHVFGNPAGGFMSLLCFTNGSLARERVARHFGLGWDAFARALAEESKPGNGGNVMLPFFTPETAPRLAHAGVELFGSERFVALGDAPSAVRAVVEAQVLLMQRYSSWIGQVPTELLVTGGASRNTAILRVISDVFQTPVRALSVANASALGGALRAAQALSGSSWGDLFGAFVRLDPNVKVEPNASTASAYEALKSTLYSRVDERLASGAPRTEARGL